MCRDSQIAGAGALARDARLRLPVVVVRASEPSTGRVDTQAVERGSTTVLKSKAERQSPYEG